MDDVVLSRPIANLSNVEVVRHVPHRWLIAQWAKLGRLSDPAMAPYVFEPSGIDLPRSIVMRVDGPAARPRLLILYYGPLLADATGGDEHGRYLDEILSARTRE